MEAQLTALADSANLSQEGKLNILGQFDTLWSNEFPTAYPILWFVTRLEWGERDFGQHQLLLRVISADGDTVLPPLTAVVTLQRPDNYEGDPVFLPLLFQMQNIPFAEEGTYTFELRAGDKIVTSTPLFVRRPPQEQGTETA